MKLRPEQLAPKLGQPLPPVILLSGDEPLQLNECADLVRRRAVEQGYSDRTLFETKRGFSWDQLSAESANLSLFADLRLFDLRLHSGAIGKDGSKAISGWCEQPPQETLLLITAPKLDRSQLKTKWVKSVEKTGYLVQIWPVEARQLPGWLEQRMRSRGLRPENGVTALLAERVEGNLLAASQEIEKLLLFKGPGPVSVEDLLKAVADSARYDVFTLVDELLSGRAARCVRILTGLRGEGEPPPLVLWALSRELRTLYDMARQVAAGDSITTALAAGRVWDKRKPIVGAALKRLNPGQIQQALLSCRIADAAVKGVIKDDPWLLFERICLSLCGVASFSDAA